MRKGFTLIELIFAIVIIGVLAAVAVPQFVGLKDKAEVNSLRGIISTLSSAAPPAYLNLTELQGYSASDLNITNLFSFDGWEVYSDNSGVWRMYGEANVTIEYDEENHTITIEADGDVGDVLASGDTREITLK